MKFQKCLVLVLLFVCLLLEICSSQVIYEDGDTIYIQNEDGNTDVAIDGGDDVDVIINDTVIEYDPYAYAQPTNAARRPSQERSQQRRRRNQSGISPRRRTRKSPAMRINPRSGVNNFNARFPTNRRRRNPATRINRRSGASNFNARNPTKRRRTYRQRMPSSDVFIIEESA